MEMPVRRGLAALLSATVLSASGLAALAGCSDTGKSPVDPAEALANAKTSLDETTGVQLDLATEELPDGVDGLKEATGVGTHAPAFKGDVVLLVNGLSLKVPVVAVDGLVYAQLPFTTEFAEIDPAEYGAPDPAQLMEPATGISSWLTEVSDVEEGDRVRDGDAVLTSYSGTLAGETVVDSIPSADESASFPVTFHITDDGELASVDISGPFYGEGGDVDYTIELTGYGTDEDISAP